MFFNKRNKRKDIQKMKIALDKTNFVVENGKLFINIDDNEINSLFDSGLVLIGSLNPKDTFKIGNREFMVVDKDDSGVYIISKGFTHTMKFGETADWKNSNIRKVLNDKFLTEIANVVGNSNIIPLHRNLLSMDGLSDYGTCEDKITLLSMDEYRKYHEVLGVNKQYGDWWWTITPASTPSNGYARGVCCVSSGGILDWCDCDYCGGVRPFLKLESSVLVSLT